MKKLVVLSGAGISAESGIKTFRDSDGLWEGHDIMEVATPEGWQKNPALVLDFYNQRRRNLYEVAPNRAHEVLVELEKYFEVVIITQNVDDLHERAGASNVLHLHGELLKVRSEIDPNTLYETDPNNPDLHLGDTCPKGGQLRPHIVWFGEAVPMIEAAIAHCQSADLFVIVGTSLVVYPAAGLLEYTPPFIPCFLVDKKIPPLESRKNIQVYEGKAGEMLPKLAENLVKNFV